MKLLNICNYWIPLCMSDQDQNNTDIAVIDESTPDLEEPKKYKVLLHNDDFTPMEFVVHVLESFFAMNRDKAVKVMLQIHYQGIGLCGVFSQEIAEAKVSQVNDYSKENEHPLLCTTEEE